MDNFCLKLRMKKASFFATAIIAIFFIQPLMNVSIAAATSGTIQQTVPHHVNKAKHKTHHKKKKHAHPKRHRKHVAKHAPIPNRQDEETVQENMENMTNNAPATLSFTDSIKKHLVNLVQKTVATLRYSVYKLGGSHFDASHGVYVVDCSSYVDQLLKETYPDAYSSLVNSSGTYKPTTLHYYNFIRGLSDESDNYWNRVSNASNLQPGDILVFRKKNHYGNFTQGHIMIVMDKPTRDEDQDVYYIRVADSAPAGHSEDTRPPHVSGIGIGTLLLKVNPHGEPLAYAWKMGSRWESRVNFAMARPVGITSEEDPSHYFKAMA